MSDTPHDARPAWSHEHDGDGWVDCACGLRHWGLFGAAGLMVFTVDAADGTGGDATTGSAVGPVRVLLQKRSTQTHNGGTWAIPGGARDSGETAVQAALREANEEADIASSLVTAVAEHVSDHGTWSYTTVVARAETAFPAEAKNWESTEAAWFPIGDVATLPLHPGFAASWDTVRAIINAAAES